MNKVEDSFFGGLMLGVLLALGFWAFMEVTSVDPPDFSDEPFPTTGREFRVPPDNKIPVECHKYLYRIPPTELD